METHIDKEMEGKWMESKKIDKLIEALSQNVKFQSREEMKKKIQKSSNRKILRKQMEMLTECSRIDYQDFCPMPESSQAIAALHRELVKADGILFMGILITLLGLFHLIKRIPIKGVQFIKR